MNFESLLEMPSIGRLFVGTITRTIGGFESVDDWRPEGEMARMGCE